MLISVVTLFRICQKLFISYNITSYLYFMTFLPMHLPVISISYNIWMLQLLHPILHPTCNLFVCSLHPICLLLLGASGINFSKNVGCYLLLLFQLASYLSTIIRCKQHPILACILFACWLSSSSLYLLLLLLIIFS